MDAATWGFIGTIVGAAASIATVWISNAHAASLQRSASERERDERRRAFQRETLLNLQDALHDELRIVTRVYISDKKAHAKKGTWGSQLLDDELNEATLTTSRKVAILLDRVADEGLRLKIKELRTAITSITLARSAESAAASHLGLMEKAPMVMEQIGISLRAQY